MDGIQGAILSVKLKTLSAANDARRAHARLYGDLLSGVEQIILPVEAPYTKHVYHIYAIQAEKRDELISRLATKEIACGIHYPVPLHLQEAYASMHLAKGAFPVAEESAQKYVSLPMFPELADDQIRYVCDELKAALIT